MTLYVSRHVSWGGARKTLNLVLEVFMVANAEWAYRMDE